MSEKIRIQKFLSNAGVTSRRKAEDAILEGRVAVNGKIVIELGTQIDPDVDKVTFDDARVIAKKESELVTIALNKPKHVLSAVGDSEDGRATLSDIIPASFGRLHHIGRLDYETTGLILLTNDGELTQLLAHPKNEIEKEYIAIIKGELKPGEKKSLLTGVNLEDGVSHFDKLRILSESEEKTLVSIVIHSGKNRIIRRMFEAVNHKVLELSRIRIGSLQLGDMGTGKYRVLNSGDITKLEQSTVREASDVIYGDAKFKKSDEAPNKSRQLTKPSNAANRTKSSGKSSSPHKPGSKPGSKTATNHKSSSPHKPGSKPTSKPTSKSTSKSTNKPGGKTSTNHISTSKSTNSKNNTNYKK
jgi:23S rRNA pseudouridine2605 synthase